eukprot:3435669-Amphidinium_carterae.1
MQSPCRCSGLRSFTSECALRSNRLLHLSISVLRLAHCERQALLQVILEVTLAVAGTGVRPRALSEVPERMHAGFYPLVGLILHDSQLQAHF